MLCINEYPDVSVDSEFNFRLIKKSLVYSFVYCTEALCACVCVDNATRRCCVDLVKPIDVLICLHCQQEAEEGVAKESVFKHVTPVGMGISDQTRVTAVPKVLWIISQCCLYILNNGLAVYAPAVHQAGYTRIGKYFHFCCYHDISIYTVCVSPPILLPPHPFFATHTAGY